MQGEVTNMLWRADVSAVANETDTAIRGGITGEDRDSAAKPDRRLEEQATGLDTPRGRGSEMVPKWYWRGLTHMGRDQSGQGRTYIREGTYGDRQ